MGATQHIKVVKKQATNVVCHSEDVTLLIIYHTLVSTKKTITTKIY